jgi:hypothetical protein
MLSPRNLGRIGLIVEPDLLTIDGDSVLPQFNFVREAGMGRVILQEVLEVLGIHERVIDGRDVEPSGVLEAGSEYESTDSTQSVDSNHI